MRIRPFIENMDYKYLEKWIDSERIHALWCANLLPYPMTRDSLRTFLEKDAADWKGSAYVATEDDGTVIGFFCYSVNTETNTGFLKFVIVDSRKRGTGCGSAMVQLALQYAFVVTGAECVQLNVFEENAAAKRCYEKAGFVLRAVDKNVFSYKGEQWSRCNMAVSLPAELPIGRSL